MSKPTAQRFVDRALAETASSPSRSIAEPIPSPAADDSVQPTDLHNPEAIAEAQAYGDLTRGALAMAGGIGLTVISLTTPGRAKVWYGLVVFGLWLFVRGVARCSRLARPFPWMRVLANAALPCAVVAASYGWVVFDRHQKVQAAAAAQLAAADKSRADQIRAESAMQRAVASGERTARLDTRVQEALARLSSDQPTTQCDAALRLGRLGSREHVGRLVQVLSSAKYTSVRGCAASALISLGETDTPMAAFTEWANSDDPDLRRGALGGFGDIGPAAAEVALPHLSEALKSPHMDVRYVATDSLTKLGPAAVPLLEVASRDADPNVRQLAAKALKAKPPG
jgi:hypothetical protein